MRAEGDGHEAEDEVDLGRLRGRMLVDGRGGAGTGEGRGGGRRGEPTVGGADRRRIERANECQRSVVMGALMRMLVGQKSNFMSVCEMCASAKV